jgi:hypothetical protein
VTELPIQRLLMEAIAVIDRLNIRYAVMGGFAVRTWGIPRPTYDADLAIAADDSELIQLLEALRRAGFEVPEEHARGFVDSLAGIGKLKVTRFEGRSVWEIDLFLARGPFLESAISRRKRVRPAGRQAWVLAPEDLILLKLLAYRRKDQLDVEEILKVTRNVDSGYLRDWARKLGVSDRLEEFLGAAG